MTASSRELVRQTLRFECPARPPRHLWLLPWATTHYGDALEDIRTRWQFDFDSPPSVYRTSPRAQGDPHAVGTYVDEWGCVFENIHEGVIGEVKQPILANLDDASDYKPPYEILPDDVASARDTVNRACAGSDKFVISGCCARPWERYQFLRGTVESMMDMADCDQKVMDLLRTIHQYYLREIEFWITTDVDAIMCMDDWGSQNQLLINPQVWRDVFRPLYREYSELAHGAGKFLFMHSDGHIGAIYDDLIEVGVDAINSQLFVMDMADLARRAKGRITFWGEIDRQHVLPAEDPQIARQAVRTVAEHLYDPRGGIIVQFEMGPGARPANAVAILEEWDRVAAGTSAQ